jgi:hypothetical protein
MTIAEEIDRVDKLSRSMIAAYVAWGPKRKWGKNYFTVFGDVTDFVNFRMETAESCLELLEKGRVADALGLCRSLLENLLLLKLLCRGNKYFQLQNVQSKTPTQVREFLAEQQKDLEEKHARGESLSCLYVAEYPRESKILMYVFEGLLDSVEPSFRIPMHFFQFQEFRPSTMRLKDEDYFDYYEPPKSVKDAQKKFQKEAKFSYRHYLSYDALLQCLQVNDLLDAAATSRVEAHYTFLGTFLHPTHDSARELHERSNVHSSQPTVGMNGTYSQAAALMAHCYVAYLLADTMNEIASFLERAPELYVAEAGTEEIRALTTTVPTSIPYFWFIDNEAPLYDRFNHAVNISTDEELEKYGGYEGLATSLLKFESSIYSHFKSGLDGWNNQRVGIYKPPLEH